MRRSCWDGQFAPYWADGPKGRFTLSAWASIDTFSPNFARQRRASPRRAMPSGGIVKERDDISRISMKLREDEMLRCWWRPDACRNAYREDSYAIRNRLIHVKPGVSGEDRFPDTYFSRSASQVPCSDGLPATISKVAFPTRLLHR